MKKLLPLFFCFPLLLLAGAQSPMQYAPFMVRPVAAAAANITHVSTATGNNGWGSTSLTFAHNISSQTKGYLVVFVQAMGSPTVSGVTQNGDAMSLITSRTSGSQKLYAFGIVAPDTGNNNIVVTPSGSTQLAAISLYFSGVNQSTPYSYSTNRDLGYVENPISTTIPSSSGELVLDAVSMSLSGGSFAASASGQVVIANAGAQAFENVVYASTNAGAASVTMTWNPSSDRQSWYNGLSLKP